jgi:hypothetical protein
MSFSLPPPGPAEVKLFAVIMHTPVLADSASYWSIRDPRGMIAQ